MCIVLLTVILKVTNKCNLKCPYCYNYSKTEENRFFDLKNLNKLLNYMYEYDDNLTLIFHGGEPSLAGLEYYKKAIDIIKNFQYINKCKIKLCMQSNFTVNNDELWKFLIANEVNIGTSFDGFLNENTRTKTQNYLNNKEKFESVNVGNSCIMIVNKNNYRKLKESLDYFFELCFEKVELHNVYHTKTINDEYDIVHINDLIEAYKELYEYICGFDETTPFDNFFEEYLNMINNNTNNLPCEKIDCRYKWIGIQPNGDYVPCGQEWNQNDDYVFGNIKDLSIKEVFLSDSYFTFSNKIQKHIEECLKKKCEIFPYCIGGCPAKNLANTGSIENIDENYCKFNKEIIKFLYKYNKDNIDNIKNKNIRKYIIGHEIYGL